MITLTREEAQQVLDALNEYVGVVVSVNEPDNWATKVSDGGEPARKAIETLRAKLSAPELEPVAWTTDLEFDYDTEIIPTKEKGRLGTSTNDIPLYTAPPQREWVGLTYEDKKEIRESTETHERETIIRLTEAKLKEKNANG